MVKIYASQWGCIQPLLWVCLLFAHGRAAGQCLPPTEPPTPYCHQAPLVCLQDICYSTNPDDGAIHLEPADWCLSNNPPHDPHYYLFQATETLIQIHIAVNSCHGMGCGLQAVITNACLVGFVPWTGANMIACDAMACAGETMILAPGNMVPGQNYWLMIDTDMEGSHCSYTIEYLDGVLLPEIASDLTSASSLDTVVCPGQDDWRAFTQTLPDVQGYYWTGLPWPPGYHLTRFADMHGNGEPLSIPDNVPPGVYQICVVGVTGCDTTDNPACFDLYVVDPGGESTPETYCAEDFNNGIDWEDLVIFQPGMYTQEYMSPEGCPYDSTKEFFEYEEPIEGYIDTVICGETLIYEGEEYFNPGTYTLYYEDATSNGCDSFATLQLDLSYIEVVTDFYCLNGSFVLTSNIVLAVPNSNGVQYRWYRNGILVSTAPTFTSALPGTFTLFLNYFQCQFPAVTNPIVINLPDLVPDPPPLNPYSNIACANEIATYSVIPDLSGAMRFYEWSVNPPGVPFTLIDTLNSGIQVNWQGFTSGTVCVNGVNHCGAGLDTCFNVTVIPAPTAGFSLPAQACTDSTITIQFTGTGTPGASYLWNFGGATIQSGGTGPGPHVLSWNSPGTHTVSLQVAEVECDTSSVTHNIFIENLGQPVLSCNSTVNSITFEWSPVFGAVNYQVNVLQGPMGTLSGTSYVVNGLAPGTTVEIQVIATGVGACPSTSATIECIAQSCPPLTIQIQIPDDSFCLGDVTGTIPLSALVEGIPSAGIWSGPGVNAGGTFDPFIAGPGVHTIVFSYSEGTCDYQRSIDVTVINSPTSTFNVDAVICQASNASVLYTGNASVNANFQWDFGTGVAIGSGAGPYSVTWNTTGLHTISLLVEENGCESELVSHTIDVQPVITAPAISCFPTTSSVTIQWSNVPNATAYDVTHLFGPMGTINGNQYVVTGIAPGDSVSIQIEVSGNTICPPVVIEASCVAENCPMPVINIDPVNDICLYTGTGTVDLNVTVTNGNGSGVWSGNGVTNVQQGIFDPNIAGEGSHLIEYHYTDNGCSFMESITISVYDPPTAVISNATFTLTCDNNSELVLVGTNSSGGGPLSYSWTTPDGMIIGPGNQTTVTAGAEGEYFLTVIDQVSMCEDVVSVTLIEDTGLPTADAGADALINCETEFAVLGGNSSSGPQFTYAWSTTGGGTIDSNPNAATITVSSGGTYTITVTDEDNGCTAVDQAFVAIDIAQPSGVLAVGDVLDCDVSTTIVSAVISPSGSYTYLWDTSDGQIVSGNGTTSILVDRAGIYTLYVTSDSNGCTDTVSIEVFADPEVIAAIDALVDNPDCPGDKDGMIEIVQIVGGSPPFTYAWSNQTSGSGLLFLAPGTYTVTVTDANGCIFVESYTLPEPVEINPEIGADLLHNYGETITITLTVTNPATVAEIIWEGVAPACTGCFQNSFLAEVSGNVFVTVIDENGCEARDTLTLTVDKNRNVFIPTVFSPNGDNINDVFRIQGALLNTIGYLRIFDRWGNVVYDQPPVVAGGAEGWDGTFKGKPLNPGVYVYTAMLIHLDGYEEAVIGDVTLVR